ncbi:MAG: hypothetical protein AW07_02976 [Candidatus Accumulibacter sp. SK-11]|nr:MAG: hypothetical protein AW07_02976 [Candidatus Accumulibacter sp. SK-11]
MPQLGGARLDLALEFVAVRRQVAVALLDLFEHGVEAAGQAADLVTRLDRRPGSVVALLRDFGHRLHEARHRRGDDAVQARQEQQRGGQCQQHEQGETRRMGQQPLLQLGEVDAQGDRAEQAAVSAHRLRQVEEAQSHGVAGRRGWCDLAGVPARRAIGRQLLALAVAQYRQHDVLVLGERREQLVCRPRVIEEQRRSAVAADHLRLDLTVPQQFAAQVEIVVAGQQQDADEKRAADGEQVDAAQLLPERAAPQPSAKHACPATGRRSPPERASPRPGATMMAGSAARRDRTRCARPR